MVSGKRQARDLVCASRAGPWLGILKLKQDTLVPSLFRPRGCKCQVVLTLGDDGQKLGGHQASVLPIGWLGGASDSVRHGTCPYFRPSQGVQSQKAVRTRLAFSHTPNRKLSSLTTRVALREGASRQPLADNITLVAFAQGPAGISSGEWLKLA